MIDIKLIREHPETVKESQRKRGFPEEDVDVIISLDKEWRSLKEEVDELRSKRNKVSEGINKAKKLNKNPESFIKEAKELPKKLEDKETLMNEKINARDKILKEIPNIVDKSVPVGDASKNKTIEGARSSATRKSSLTNFGPSPKYLYSLINKIF